MATIVYNVIVNTKAIVRFHVNDADWLSDRTKDRLNKLVSGY